MCVCLNPKLQTLNPENHTVSVTIQSYTIGHLVLEQLALDLFVHVSQFFEVCMPQRLPR
jgi:hypothetical protein